MQVLNIKLVLRGKLFIYKASEGKYVIEDDVKDMGCVEIYNLGEK